MLIIKVKKDMGALLQTVKMDQLRYNGSKWNEHERNVELEKGKGGKCGKSEGPGEGGEVV